MLPVDETAVAEAFRQTTWGNTTETAARWAEILGGDDEPRRFRLFERLFREDGTGQWVKRFYGLDEMKKFLRRLDRPYYRPDAERRRLVWRSVYLDIPCEVPELAWVITPRAGG